MIARAIEWHCRSRRQIRERLASDGIKNWWVSDAERQAGPFNDGSHSGVVSSACGLRGQADLLGRLRPEFSLWPAKTYRWYDDDHNTRESQYRRRNSSDQRVRNTADQELMQRGFRQGAVGRQIFG